MALSRKPISRNPRRTIKRVGSRGQSWIEFRREKASRDENEEGLIRCECHKLGFQDCGIALEPSQMHLHHLEGRDGSLLLDESKMAWLTGDCHDKAHNSN